SIPVIDENNRIVGMPSALELMQLLLPGDEIAGRARHVRTPITNIVRALDGKLLHAAGPQDEEDNLVMMVAASSHDVIKQRMENFKAEELLLLAGDRDRIHRLAAETGVRALVLTGGAGIAAESLELAKQNGVTVIATERDTASTTQLIRCSRRISNATSGDFMRFTMRTLLSDVTAKVRTTPQQLFPVVKEGDDELLGVFSKSDLVDPPLPRLVLVDHNEFSQAVAGADEAEIIEVIDHHRLSGNLITKEPVQFINMTVGSTCTIVAKTFRNHRLKPRPGTAICLCAGIISDTLNLTSPTSTSTDREMLEWLAPIAGIDTDEFTKEFFAAGSALKTLPIPELLDSDRKEFNESGFKISISQIEELDHSSFWEKEGELRAGLESLRIEGGYDFALLLITDILKKDSLLMVCGSPEIIAKIDYPQRGDQLYEMSGVVSRKKQVFPWVSRLLSEP
ncbi:MAG: putative manganese-dependent inorganic diphosphatase, partial [Verrucomicrobiales bacterium]